MQIWARLGQAIFRPLALLFRPPPSLLLVFTLASGGSLIAESALAQVAPSASAPTPPLVQRVDSNGIDLQSGTYAFGQAKVSIGTPLNGGLSHSYSISSGLWSDENMGTISVLAGVYTVSIGNVSDVFNLAGTTFSPARENGSTLTYSSSNQTYTYTNPKGAVAVFSTLSACGASQTVLQSLTYPSGIAYTYNYVLSGSCYVLASVASNTGYLMEYSWGGSTAPTTITAINTSVDYCNPASIPCSGLTQSWPTAQVSPITQSGSGSTDRISWSVTDPLGQVTTTSGVSAANGLYCGEGQGQQPDFVFTLTETHPAGLAKTYTYPDFCTNSGAGPIQSVSYTGGGTWQYTFTKGGGLNNGGLPLATKVSGPNGQVRTIGWIVSTTNLVNGNAVSDIGTDQDAYSNTTTYTYDSYGRVATVTYPEGNEDEFTYDARGNVTQETKVPKSGSGLTNIVLSAGYDATCSQADKCNEPNWTKDGKGNETDFTYDTTNGTGLLLSVTKPAGSNGVRPQTRYSYSQIPTYAKNSSGTLVQTGSIWMLVGTSTCATGTAPSCVGTSDETRTIISYAGSNNAQPTSVTVESGDGVLISSTSTTYDMVGNVATKTGPLGSSQVTQYYYDADREDVGEIGPVPSGSLPNRAIRTTYSGDGKVTLVEKGTTSGQSPSAWTAFSSISQTVKTYDALDRLATQSETAGGSTSSRTDYSYDVSNRLICTAVRMNAATFNVEPNACTLGTQGSDGPDRITLKGYDYNDRLTSVIDAYGVAGVQRTTRTLTYSANGNMLTEKDANGNTTSFAYDGFDRLSTTTYPIPAGGSATTEVLAYDANGNVLQDTRRDSQVVTKTYDALNRVTAISNPSTTLGYDNYDRLTSSSRNGLSLTYGYDALSRQTSEAGPDGTTHYGYDLDGNVTQITWPDSFVVNYAYDLVKEVTTIQENAAGSGLVLATYTYNNLGQRSTVTLGNAITTTYGYDSAFRLNSIGHAFPSGQTGSNETLTLTRDEADEILSRTSSNTTYDWGGESGATRSYTTNALNQITAVGSAAYSYDARGNLASDSVNSFSYDVENNLTSFNTNTTLATDGEGRLAVVDDLSGGVPTSSSRSLMYGSTKEFGGSILAEYGVSSSDNGTLYRRYVPGPWTDETVVWYDSSDSFARRWLLPDERGSVIAVTNASGALTAANTYDEYGVPGGGNLGRFQYTGQIWVPELGLYHYKARDYSPTLGRFLQSDPVGYGPDMDWYVYVGDDPVDHADPSGKCIEDFCFLEIAFAVASCSANPACRTAVGGVVGAVFGGGASAVHQATNNHGRIDGGKVFKESLKGGAVGAVGALTLSPHAAAATAVVVYGGDRALQAAHQGQSATGVIANGLVGGTQAAVESYSGDAVAGVAHIPFPADQVVSSATGSALGTVIEKPSGSDDGVQKYDNQNFDNFQQQLNHALCSTSVCAGGPAAY